MKKREIANQLARKSGVSPAEAADRLDYIVHQILTQLREGKEAPLPGFGTFALGPDGEVTFEPAGKRHG